MSSALRVAEIWIYPVKSCHGISLEASELLPTGLRWDRHWMIVRPDGSMLTQREKPQMARLLLSLKNDQISMQTPSGLIELAMKPGVRPERTRKVRVWNDDVEAGVEPDARLHAYLSDVIGEPVELVGVAQGFHRQVTEAKVLLDQPVRFADQQPLMIATRASLRELNNRMDEEIPIHRFRPNLVLEDESGAAFAEDGWSTIQLPGARIEIRQRVARCPITTIDQDEGRKISAEPLKTLAGFRRDKNKVYFGVHAFSKEGGHVSVGDGVRAFGVGSL